MSQAAGGILGGYNSLMDKNLNGYFANTRMRKHLVKSGLITREGQVTSENAYRVKMAKREHNEHVRDLKVNAIIEKALDMQRMRQHEIRKKLDELYKIELVRKVRSERSMKVSDELYELLSPRSRKQRKPRAVKSAAAVTGHRRSQSSKLPNIHYDDRTARQLAYESGYMDSDSTSRFSSSTRPRHRRTKSAAVPSTSFGKTPHPPQHPHPLPPKSKKKKKRKMHRGLLLAKSEQLIAHRIQVQSMAEVTMKYLGSALQLSNDMFPANKLCEVQVIQQHCGASTVCVFRELLPPNTVFTFVSRRHRGSPFGLTINIDGIKNIRISSCCEYKHKPGHRIGGKTSQFGLIAVQGAAPCYRCQVRLNLIDQEKKEIDEKEVSSDEEAATRSFDIIVSRGGKREEIVRPVSTNATTQTDAKIVEQEVTEEKLPVTESYNDYNDDDFDDDDDGDERKIVDGLTSSSDSSDSDVEDSDDDQNSSDEDDDKAQKEILRNSESGDESESVSDIDDDNNNDADDDVDVGEQSSGKLGENNVAVESERKSVRRKQSNGKVVNIKSKSSSDEDSDSDSEQENSSNMNDSNNNQQEHVYVKEQPHSSDDDDNKRDSDDDSKRDSDHDNKRDSDDGSGSSRDSKKDSESEHSDGERIAVHSDSESDDDEATKKKGDSESENEFDRKEIEEEEQGRIESESIVTISVEEGVDDDDEERNFRREGVSSTVSRESTILTGNEDGGCDNENKTIQFNEEVDVVRYDKSDADSAIEATPLSDDDDDDEDFTTIRQSGGEHVMLADLSDGDDDDNDNIELDDPTTVGSDKKLELNNSAEENEREGKVVLDE